MTTRTAAAAEISPRERIIVALDVSTPDAARDLVRELRGQVGAFKIGMQLFTAAGPSIVREIVELGERVFLDLKFHDIPNTVANASLEAARLGVWMLNVHASGGAEMMRRTVEYVTISCEKEGIERPLLIGVTVLTSSDASHLAELNIGGSVSDQVVRLASLAAYSGLDGVVASPQEVVPIRKALGAKPFLLVTPGIRPLNAAADDQKRVTTFGDAIRLGTDYAVIGRPITAADDKLMIIEEMLREVETIS